MTIIDNTQPYSPILEYKPKPGYFKNELARQKYWMLQKKTWIDGIDEIPGTLVHKTQEQQIKHRNTGEIFRPVCRDVDLLIHQEIDQARKDGQALVIIKGRGIGLSCEMGCLANYFMRVYPGSTSLFTSSEQTKISALFSDKVMTTFNSYDTDIRPMVKRLNDTSHMVYLKAEVKSRKDDGTEFTADSEIFCKETADTDASASGFSGRGCIFGAYDELFLHKRKNLLLKSSSSCYVEQSTGKVLAFLLAGGSVEETLTLDELSKLKALIEDVQKSGRLGILPARLLFIPASWGKFMTNGHTDHEKAKEWWEKEIEDLGKLEDKSALRAFRMNNPMSLDDIFELAKGGVFEEDVTDKIHAQYKVICDVQKKGEEFEQRVKLVDLNGKIETYPDHKGVVWISEAPKPNVDYYQVIDGVATGNKTGEKEGSNVAGLIMKMFDPAGYSYQPVALLYERPEIIEQSYFKLTNLARRYNLHGGLKGIMAEANAGTADHFSTHLEKLGMGKFIMNRKDLSGKGNVNVKKLFQYVTIDVRDWQIRQANIFLRKHMPSIRMKMVLEDLMKSSVDNADIRDAFFMFFVAAGANFDKQIVKKVIKREVVPQLVFKGGKYQWETRQVGQPSDRRGGFRV